MSAPLPSLDVPDHGAPARSPEAPHARAASDVVAALQTDAAAGLSVDEVAIRAARFGPNELPAAERVPRWHRLVAQFKDVLVVLLLAATVVSLIVWLLEGATGVPIEALVILGIVVFNAVLGYLQEERAEQAVAALRAMTVLTVTVIRGGEPVRVASRELVPGDIMLIEEGDAVGADGRLLNVTSLQMSEAALTGESEPVAKSVEPVDEDASTADRTDMVFTGTVATFGRARAVVTGIGLDTEIGRIASMLERAPERQTPLQLEIAAVGRALGIAVVIVAAIVVGSILLTSRLGSTSDLVAVLLLGVSLAVAAVPEGLATVLTVVLALGVQRMARRNAIVKKLSAVETLGSATVIGSDKTGTLTRNEMTVRVVRTASGSVELTGSGYEPRGELVLHADGPGDDDLALELRFALSAAATATNAILDQRDGAWSIQGDPTEGALLAAARKAAVAPEPRTARMGELPFSSERKLMSVVHPDRDDPRLLAVYVKGAPDVLLHRCTHELVGRTARPLSDDRRAAIAAGIEELAKGALRTIGVARGSVERDSYVDPTEDLERHLTFLGAVGMMDPPRAESRDAVATAHAAGIRVIMITGDHPATASAIAAELGIAQGPAPAVTGPHLHKLDADELRSVVRETDVYARVSPEHKLRIVEALEADRHVVAMTGDGVNDAPALKTADIGISMGITGTEVAKQAADVILTDDNFATIVAAVEEGRTIFSNIRKFIRYLLSSNVGEVLTMFLGVVLAPVIGLVTDEAFTAPLLATQILWINLLTDAAPALALGVDPPNPALMRRRPRSRSERLIDRPMWLGILVVGLAMAAATLFTLDLALPGGLIEGTSDLTHARTMAFTVLVLAQLFNVFNSRSDEASAFGTLFAGGMVWAAVGMSVALQVLVVYVPFLHRGFGTVPLDAAEWGICVAAGSVVLWTDELWKLVRRRAGGRGGR
ncbi:MAG TPA: cation-translocating P-type ATPase [Actinomycetota bacterium]